MTEQEIKDNAPCGAMFYFIDECGGLNYIANINRIACLYIEFTDGSHVWQPMCIEVINDVKGNLKKL